MATLFEYFTHDFKDASLDRSFSVTVQNRNDLGDIISEELVEVVEKVRHISNSSIRIFTYYIDKTAHILGIINALIDDFNNQIEILNTLEIIDGKSGDISIGNHVTFYSNRVYFYTESLISKADIERLNVFCLQRQIYLTIRDSNYVKTMVDIEQPLAFISHDSRDKALIAGRIAAGLSSRLCTVWYDEYSLQIGDSLRESIEKGIKEAKKCILVITKNFLDNPGWGKREFDSIFTREMIMEERIVLPIWYGVTKQEVYNYSPSLANTFALVWPSSEGKSEDEYKKQVEEIISKIHVTVTK